MFNQLSDFLSDSWIFSGNIPYSSNSASGRNEAIQNIPNNMSSHPEKKSETHRKLLIQKKKLLNYQSNGRFVKRYFMFFWNNQSSLMTLIFISDRTFWIESGSKDCGILHQMFYVFHYYYYGLVRFGSNKDWPFMQWQQRHILLILFAICIHSGDFSMHYMKCSGPPNWFDSFQQFGINNHTIN